MPEPARLTQVQRAESEYGDPLPFDAEAARAFAQVAADIRRSERESKARALEALIAATAKATQLPLHTFNTGDFASINGVDVVAVPPKRAEPAEQ